MKRSHSKMKHSTSGKSINSSRKEKEGGSEAEEPEVEMKKSQSKMKKSTSGKGIDSNIKETKGSEDNRGKEDGKDEKKGKEVKKMKMSSSGKSVNSELRDSNEIEILRNSSKLKESDLKSSHFSKKAKSETDSVSQNPSKSDLKPSSIADDNSPRISMTAGPQIDQAAKKPSSSKVIKLMGYESQAKSGAKTDGSTEQGEGFLEAINPFHLVSFPFIPPYFLEFSLFL